MHFMLTSTSRLKLDQFCGQFSLFQYKKHDAIEHAGSIPLAVFYIKSGYVRVYTITEAGEELTVTILKLGDFFPLTVGIDDIPNTYYLDALTYTTLFKVPKDNFLGLIKSNPDILYDLTNHILTHFGDLLTRMEYLVVSRAYSKVAATLLTCAKSLGEIQDGQVVVRVPLTHKDIAALAGITRETTCLEMKKLEQKGLVERVGRLLVVKNLKKLEEESLLI